MEMNRRTFFGLGAGALVTRAMPFFAAAQAAAGDSDFADALIRKYMKVTPLEIAVGAKKPFKIFHFSDTHITCWGPKDIRDEKDFLLYERRSKHFNTAMAVLAASIAYAKKKGVPMLHTGDLLDFESEANLDAARAAFRGEDFNNAWVAGVPGKPYPAGLTALMKWVRTQKLLKALLCGHTHFEYRDEIAEGVTQYVAGGNYEGYAYEITFT